MIDCKTCGTKHEGWDIAACRRSRAARDLGFTQAERNAVTSEPVTRPESVTTEAPTVTLKAALKIDAVLAKKCNEVGAVLYAKRTNAQRQKDYRDRKRANPNPK